MSAHYQDLALDCFKIKNMNADEKITTSAMLVIVLEGEYEYTFKGSKLIQGSSHDKILFGSIV